MLKLLSLLLVAISLNLGLINAQTTTASNCGYGFYKNGAVCTICPAGYSCNGLTKTACPLGTSTNNATGAGQCTECLQDTYAPTVGSKFCLACPAGSFCPNKTTAIACGKGTAGRINQYDYRWNASQCLACPVGTYASVTGSSYCKPCTNGSYCADPTLAPVACPKGTSSMVDTTNTNTLLYYSPDAQGWLYYNNWNTPITIQYDGYQFVVGSMCFPCPVGFYADQTGLTYCKVCPSGYYCADKTIAPVKCPKGYFSQNGTYNNYMWPQVGDSCTKCPVGTYTPTTGAVQCSSCPDGKFCPDPSLDPVTIQAGFYSQNNSYWNGNSYVYVSTLYQCSPGYYVPNNTNGTNSTYNNYYMNGYNCVACPAGYYCQDPKKAPIPCPPGFYSQYGYASSCQPCSAGYYASQPGSTQCTQCPMGSYCADPTVEPTLCPPGSYSSNYGQSQCYACSPGYNYASQPGSTTCNQCPMDCCCKDPTQEPVCSGSGSSTPNWWQTTPPYWGQSTSGWNNYWQSSSPPYNGWSSGQSTPPPWQSTQYGQSTPPPWQSTQNGQSSYPYSSQAMGRR